MFLISCESEAKMIVKRQVWFSPARQERTLHLYLPDDYAFSDERYPVMYMFDGHNLFFDSDATYGKSWGMKNFLDYWDKKIIVAGIECSHEGNARLTEYCPYYWNSGWAGEVFGTGEDTMRWMVDELKPLIDSEYRTWPHREATGIGGSSMGGLMALYAGICHNDVYSKMACVSSAISFCGRELRDAIASHPLNPDSRFFLSWGGRETRSAKGRAIMKSCNKSMNDRLYKKGCSPYMFYQADGGHCEADWERQVPLFMNWLWK